MILTAIYFIGYVIAYKLVKRIFIKSISTEWTWDDILLTLIIALSSWIFVLGYLVRLLFKYLASKLPGNPPKWL